MNGGSLASNAEPATSPVYSATNGAWVSTTGVFTPITGNPSATVTVGDFAHVFTDGSTTPTFIGRVTAVNTATVTVSLTLKGGTAPTTAVSGISINVGGAWAGPSGTVGFPWGFANFNMSSSSTNVPRVNFKNDQTYGITATLVNGANGSGPITYQGYTTTFGDKGRFVIDGGSPAGTSFDMMSFASNGVTYFEMGDFEIRNNGTGGSGSGITNAGDQRLHFFRGVVHNIRGFGFNAGYCEECEAYACNGSNGGNSGAFVLAAFGRYVRCIAHDNVGSNGNGFYDQAGGVNLLYCISESNGGNGYFCQNISFVSIFNSDFYNNAGDGILLGGFSGNSRYYIENCNAILNGGFGLNFTNTVQSIGRIYNCGFGAGSAANTSGATSLGSLNGVLGQGLIMEGNIQYPSNVTPWVDPANGDFRINLSQAINAGLGRYTQTAASYAGAVGFPDIGSAQHLETGGASGPVGQLKQFSRGAPY